MLFHCRGKYEVTDFTLIDYFSIATLTPVLHHVDLNINPFKSKPTDSDTNWLGVSEVLTWFVLLISRKHRHLPDQVYAATGQVLLVFIMIER